MRLINYDEFMKIPYKVIYAEIDSYIENNILNNDFDCLQWKIRHLDFYYVGLFGCGTTSVSFSEIFNKLKNNSAESVNLDIDLSTRDGDGNSEDRKFLILERKDLLSFLESISCILLETDKEY